MHIYRHKYIHKYIHTYIQTYIHSADGRVRVDIVGHGGDIDVREAQLLVGQILLVDLRLEDLACISRGRERARESKIGRKKKREEDECVRETAREEVGDETGSQDWTRWTGETQAIP
jgi:hypothetical protein